MLKSIDPLLNADVLHAIASMGHGNDLILCDSNFPADAVGRMTTYGRALRIDANAPRAARALLSLFPLDTFVDVAAVRMEMVGTPNEIPRCSRRCRRKSTGPRGGTGRLVQWSVLRSTSRPRSPTALCRHVSAASMAASCSRWVW